MKQIKSTDKIVSELLKHLAPNCYIGHGLNSFSREDAAKAVAFIQSDLLSQAREGFEEKFGEEPKDGDSWDWANRKVGWQAATLANEKKHQEELKHKQSVIDNLESIRESQLARIEELEKTVASQEKERQRSEAFWKEKLGDIQKENERLNEKIFQIIGGVRMSREMNKPIRCTTHFHACDCREYEFERLKEENEKLQKKLDDKRVYIKQLKDNNLSLTELIEPMSRKLDEKDAEIEKLKTKLNTCKNDYWFMINLIEKYGSDKEQTLKDCLERMKFRKPMFNLPETPDSSKEGV